MQMKEDEILSCLSQIEKNDKEFQYDCRIVEIELNVVKNLRGYRKSLHISQEEVAKKSGLTRQMVSRVETFSHSPNLTTLIKYLWALDVDFSQIIGNLQYIHNKT